jgi:hypothetical protein
LVVNWDSSRAVPPLGFWAKIFWVLSTQIRAGPFKQCQEFAGNLFGDEWSMEDETRVVVIVGGKKQVTLIIIILHLDHNNH